MNNFANDDSKPRLQRTHTGTCRFEGCGNRTTVYESENRNGEMCGECYMKLHPWKPPYWDDSKEVKSLPPRFDKAYNSECPICSGLSVSYTLYCRNVPHLQCIDKQALNQVLVKRLESYPHSERVGD